MIAIVESIDPTRLCGIAAYGVAVITCILVWAGTRRVGAGLRLALVLAIIDTVLLLDMIFNWRWMLHQFFVDTATRESVYGRRHRPQEAALVVLFVVFLAVCGLALRRLRGRSGAVLAVWGTICSIGLWLVEVISLHRVDRILYRGAGPLLSVSFLWIAACLMTSIGILLEARSAIRAKHGAPRRMGAPPSPRAFFL